MGGEGKGEGNGGEGREGEERGGERREWDPPGKILSTGLISVYACVLFVMLPLYRPFRSRGSTNLALQLLSFCPFHSAFELRNNYRKSRQISQSPQGVRNTVPRNGTRDVIDHVIIRFPTCRCHFL